MKTADKRHKTGSGYRLSNRRRRGAAAVELAVVSPILLLIAIGIIDVGQFVSVGQIVNNASREGARVAIRSDTEWVSEVEAVVLAYITDAIGGVSPDTISSSLEVSVADEYGTVSGGDLTTVSSGSEVSVQVAFDYGNIRWATNTFFSGITDIQATTTMRRE